MYFSPDGSKLAYIHLIDYQMYGAYLGIMDFDRATGELSNLVQDHFTNFLFSLGLGVSFSPNGKLLYTTNKNYVFQDDLFADDIKAS